MKTKLNKKMAGCLLGLSSLLLAGQASAIVANDVFIDPAAVFPADGSTFNLNVRGNFEDTTIGGGFLISWDTNFINIISTGTDVADSLVTNGWGFSGSPAVITSSDIALDIVPGTLGSFTGVFDIVTLTFQAVAPGATSADLAIGSLGPDWVDIDFFTVLPVHYTGATVEVSAVPVPAAVWLFGSGLIGLVGVARRRKLAQA